ncbi:MAG: hypothetical protein ACRD32_03165, partial [Nitrososphaerales archaeon]
DSTAGASPTYTIEACLSATAGNAEAKILAIQGLESSFTDGVNVATTAGFFVDIATLITDLTANDHIIIAQVQIDFDGTATIPAGDIELRNSAGTMLAENQFEIMGASGAVGDGSAITLIAVVAGGSANTSYKVAVKEPAGGVAGAEAKILAIKPDVSKVYFSDGGSVAVGTSATQLTSLTSSFSSNQKIVIMSASQFDDTDGGAVENLIATSGHEIRENSIAKSGNQMAIQELATSGSAGEGIRHTLIWYGSAGGASLGYDSRATASATGYDGESKLLAFSVQENLFPSDTPSLSESVTLKQNLFPSDTPSLSESVTLKQKLFPSDTPSLSESVTLKQKLFPSDTPTLSESVTIKKSLSVGDTPTLSESVTLKQKLFPSDTPSLSETVTIKQNLFPNDTPSLSESTVVSVIHSLSAADTTSLSESTIVSLIHSLSAGDTPSLSEFVTLKQNLFPNEIPSLSDSVTLKQKLFPSDTPTLSESVTIKQSLSPTDTPFLSDSATVSLIQGISATDTPTLSESVALKQNLFPSDTPSLSDSATVSLIQGLSTNDTPLFFESVTLKQSLFPSDNPTINDAATAQKKSTRNGGGGGDLTAPLIVSSTLTLLGDPKSGSGVIIGENNDLNNLSLSRPIKVGEGINLKFNVIEDSGINSLTHATLYIGKGKSVSELAESDTYIRFEKDKQFEISDPHKLFSDVSFALLKKDTTNFVFRFDITFAKPMEKSSILFRTWDLSRNVAEVWYVDALEVIEKEMPLQESQSFGAKNETVNTPGAISADQRFLVEKWAGYNAESLSDNGLLKFLGIISSQSGEEDNQITIPSWFKNNVAIWVLEG